MSADPARAALDRALLDWMAEPGWRADEERFARLALDLFAFQFAHCSAYRRFCEGRGAVPGGLRDWREIPPVPTGAFKELTLTCFAPERTAHVFRTSGTSTSARGALHLDTLALYEASLLPTFRRFLLPDLAPGERAHVVALAPSAEDAPDSSLSHMFHVAMREIGDSASFFAVRAGALEARRVVEHLGRCEAEGPPLLLCGAAFAFVHLLDAMEADGLRLALPRRTRIMETGGFKGRARERTRDELYAEIETRLAVPPARVVNQYGMTELGSQFYDSNLARPDEPRRKLGPPWARVRVLDPTGGEPAEVGALHVFDLANTGSVLAVQTADLGRVLGDGFEVIGREADAEARGCSIAIDELLGEDA